MTTHDFPDGLIAIDSELGKKIGFTSDIFLEHGETGSQFYKKGNSMHIQAIERQPGNESQGRFDTLCEKLWSFGFTVKVPNPRPQFKETLLRRNFEMTDEQSLTTTRPDLDVVYFKRPPVQS